jgi:two-component system chemotaxis response regulator CheB/chemosensory pili system protein ChpB (putative protein-glutamate methylesterase)
VPETLTPVAVALLYQTNQLGGHLRDALKDLGAAVVYEALTADIDRDKLEGSGARVVIVNLDNDSDPQIDHVYDLLDEGDYQVVFNEAQVSANLSGWDHARWARNLAAKVLKQPEIAEPPRPPGAEAVPTPVQSSAAAVPIAEKPGEPVPEKPAASASPAQLVPTPAELTPAERPTVKMPLPEFSHEAAAPGADLDIAELAEFAQLAEPDVGVSGNVAQAAFAAPIEPAPIPDSDSINSDSTGNFAAELDALFADADAKARSAPVAAKADDLGFDLPDEFNLAEDMAAPAAAPAAAIEAIDIPFDLAGVQTPPASPAPSGKAKVPAPELAELHTEFPAIFDQLDGAAAAIPEASDGTFKPAGLPAAPSHGDDADLSLPMEWTLEHADDTAPGKPFGVEKISADEYLAPQVDAPAAGQQPAIPALGLTLELMPMEEAIAPTYHNPEYAKEAWLDESRPAQKLKVGTGAGVQRVFVLGASIGGPEAVRDFLTALPAGFPVLFVLAQHMGEEFLELMSAQLAKSVALTVRNPSHGERVSHGEILVVPTTHRMQVDAEGVITLAHLPEKSQYSPSIDQVLHDIADAFGSKAGAIIFSGMAHDAIEGSQYLKSKGGTIWVQDPDTCVISSMVDGAREAGVVAFVGSPQQLAAKMIADYGKG